MTEKQFYDECTGQSLRVYAKEVSAADEKIGTRFTMELEVVGNPEDCNVLRTHREVNKLRSKNCI